MKRYNYKMHNQWMCAPRIGELKPCFIQEVTPGDTWRGRSSGVFRLAPLDVPTYMSLNIFVHFFFVPHRLTFPEFEDVITGADTTTAWPVIPYNIAQATGWLDYGVPVSSNHTDDMNALPVRAFNKIYNDHFRNHLIETERAEDSLTVARCRFPSSDYFGGITDEIQQGAEETIDTSNPTLGVTAVTEAIRRQRMKERRSQYGERYRDYLLSDFNVRAPDSRLDRPEHLARGKTTIGISEVVATATSASENTGEYRGHGIAGMRINFPKKYFTEHGTIMGVMYARPRLQLKNRIDKIWKIQDKDDLYNPLLASDKPVIVGSREIYADTITETNFGYVPRDEWLRSGRDTIAGNLSATATPWTANVELAAVPTSSYLQQVQDYDFIFQDQTSARNDLTSFFDHKIGKSSYIKPRKR